MPLPILIHPAHSFSSLKIHFKYHPNRKPSMFGAVQSIGPKKGSVALAPAFQNGTPMGWDRVRHRLGTRGLLACSSGLSAAGDERMKGRRFVHEQWTVSHRAGTGSMATPAHTRSSAQPCAPPSLPPPPRPPLRLVLRLLLRGRGAQLPCRPPGQHRRGLHDRQRPPRPRSPPDALLQQPIASLGLPLP